MRIAALQPGQAACDESCASDAIRSAKRWPWIMMWSRSSSLVSSLSPAMIASTTFSCSA